MTFHTEVKTSLYFGEIEELVKRYSDNFVQFLQNNDDRFKYAALEGKKLIIVSNCDAADLTGSYNLYMSVSGADKEDVRETMAELEAKLGIEAKTAPPELRREAEELARIIFRTI